MKQVTIPAQWLQELIALCGPEDHELRERVMNSAAPAPADALATATGLPAQAVDAVDPVHAGLAIVCSFSCASARRAVVIFSRILLSLGFFFCPFFVVG